MSAPTPRRERLWRARRHRHHLDAWLCAAPSGWLLTFRYDGRDLVTWRFDRREAASAEAERRLEELLRAGWNAHW